MVVVSITELKKEKKKEIGREEVEKPIFHLFINPVPSPTP